MDPTMPSLWAFFILMLLGWTCNLLKKWNEAWKAGNRLHLRAYYLDNLPGTLLSIFGSLLLFALFAFTGELQAAPIIGAWTAASIGYIGNSAGDIIGQRARASIPRYSADGNLP